MAAQNGRVWQISPEFEPHAGRRVMSAKVLSALEGGIARRTVPPGSAEKYGSNQNLLRWMSEQFERFGDIYMTSIYGTLAFVTRDPGHPQHVLRENWHNYTKGLAIKRRAAAGQRLDGERGRILK
jgi:hypothetical protein